MKWAEFSILDILPQPSESSTLSYNCAKQFMDLSNHLFFYLFFSILQEYFAYVFFGLLDVLFLFL